MTDHELLLEHDRLIKEMYAKLFPPIDLRATDEEQRVNDPRFPSRAEVRIHFESVGRMDAEADWEGFFLHYDAQGWRAGNGVEVGNWKSLAGKWLRKNPKAATELVLTPPEVTREYVPPVNRIAEARKREEEQGGDPCPDDVRIKLAALGIMVGGRRNVRVDSGLTRAVEGE